MTTGKVKWFSNAKGFGFILSDAGDILVHHSNIDPEKDGFKTLQEGEEVEYEYDETTHGLRASVVKRAEGGAK